VAHSLSGLACGQPVDVRGDWSWGHRYVATPGWSRRTASARRPRTAIPGPTGRWAGPR